MKGAFVITVLAIVFLLNADLANPFGFCSETVCELANSYTPKCCKNDDCCSSFAYSSESAVLNAFQLGIGAIVGIAVGAIVLIILCIIGCVCCCCRPNQRNQGTVLATTAVTTHPVTMQQYPNQQYPAGGPQYVQQYPGAQQPAYNPASPTAAPYPAKDPNAAGYNGAPPPPY